MIFFGIPKPTLTVTNRLLGDLSCLRAGQWHAGMVSPCGSTIEGSYVGSPGDRCTTEPPGPAIRRRSHTEATTLALLWGEEEG